MTEFQTVLEFKMKECQTMLDFKMTECQTELNFKMKCQERLDLTADISNIYIGFKRSWPDGAGLDRRYQ